MFWRGLTTRGALLGGWLGLVTAVTLILLSTAIWVKVPDPPRTELRFRRQWHRSGGKLFGRRAGQPRQLDIAYDHARKSQLLQARPTRLASISTAAGARHVARLDVQIAVLVALISPALAVPGAQASRALPQLDYSAELLRTQATGANSDAPASTAPADSAITGSDAVPSALSTGHPDAQPGQQQPPVPPVPLSRSGAIPAASLPSGPDDGANDLPSAVTRQPVIDPSADKPGAATGGPGTAETVPGLPLPPNTARLAVSSVLGRLVVGPDGKEIGRLVDVLVDGMGAPRAGVIDFGGFMGLGSRKIAVEWSAFAFPPSGSDAELTITLTPEEIKNTPEFAGQGKPVSVVGPGTPAPGHGP